MAHPTQQDLYVDDPRAEVATFIPRGARSALDVGCGRGGFGTSLRHALGPGARIVGVEPVAAQADVAAVGHGYDEVRQGHFPDVVPQAQDSWDLICFNDVLEHLVDPWAAVREAAARLSPGGHVVASIPNVRYFPVIVDLLRRDRWDYTDWGVLDRTHLRFFTRSTMRELFESAGFVVVADGGINSAFQLAKWRRFRWLAGRIGSSEHMQHVVVARHDG